MMNRTNLILIGVLVVQLGLIAAVHLSKSDASIAKLEPILELDAAAVQKIEIFAKDAVEKNDGAPAIILDRSSGTWQLGSHFDYPAVGSKVDELITNLAGMKAREPVANKATTHRKFAVAEDKYERRLIIHQKVGEPIELFVGVAAGAGQVAVRQKGQEKVFGATGVTSYGIATSASSWIERDYYKLAPGVASLVITNGSGEFELKRDAAGSPWKRFAGDAEVPVPEGKVLDEAKVGGLGNKLANIVLSEPADPALAGETPVVTVRFKAVGDENEHVMRIGAETDNRLPIVIDTQVPVWVAKSVLQGFIDLTGEDLYRDPPKEGETPPAPTPPGGAQLPPDILRQLQEQGISPP